MKYKDVMMILEIHHLLMKPVIQIIKNVKQLIHRALVKMRLINGSKKREFISELLIIRFILGVMELDKMNSLLKVYH